MIGFFVLAAFMVIMGSVSFYFMIRSFIEREDFEVKGEE